MEVKNKNNNKVIKDCDKLYLIVYLNISNMASAKADAYLSELTNRFKRDFDDTVRTIVLPTKEQPTHIEVFKADAQMDKISMNMDKIIDAILKSKTKTI